MSLVFGGLCLFQAGWIAGQLIGNDAHAEEPDAIIEAPIITPGSPPMLCKAFEVDAAAPEVDTSNVKSPLGDWVSDREGEGWVMYGVDLELGQKATGYPQAWVQVCLYRP